MRLNGEYMAMSKKEQTYVVEGFAFFSEKEAEQAKKELEGIRYIKEKTNMNNPDMVLQIYNKMVREKMFATAVGYAYLFDIQEYLRTNLNIRDEDILPIEIIHPSVQERLQEVRHKHQLQIQKMKKEAKKKSVPETEMQKKYKLSLLVNLILAISVVFMFIISATSDYPTILNYEETLINRYSAWEHELTEREATLREAGY